MTEDFNKWWNADQGYDGVTNPYRSDSAVYWAWEGWQAGVEAERKKFCSDLAALHDVYSLQSVSSIRVRGEE